MASRAPQWLASLIATTALTCLSAANAGETASSQLATSPVMNPHTLNLELDFKTLRRRRAGNIESSGLLAPAIGLRPLAWPRNGDMRARLLTPELKRAPLVGWIATNLYRSKSETGWCLEVDPGEGEYIVFYRVHLKR